MQLSTTVLYFRFYINIADDFSKFCPGISLSSNKTVHPHTEHETLQLLQRDTPEFIAPDLWPPNSPDLNPVDYKIWGMIKQRVYQTRICDITELKERLIDVWRGLQQSVVDEAIDDWRKRLRACVHVKGGHFVDFEHLI